MTATLHGPADAATSPSLSDDLFDALTNAARLAPSPDNNQPWALRRTQDSVEVYHVRERAVRSDVRDLFSWLAVGSAIENIALAVTDHGYRPQVAYHSKPFPLVGSHERIATITLRPGGAADPLVSYLAERVTNRKLYRKEPLPKDVIQRLSSAVNSECCEIAWLTDRNDIKTIAGLVRAADYLRFTLKSFHEELHAVLRLTEDEAKVTADGLGLKALEIPRAMAPVLRFLRPWSRMRWANRLGMGKMLARMASQQVIASGALGLLVTKAGDRGYLDAGRSLQRLWLKATQENLAMQPLGSIPLFLTKFADEPDAFAPWQKASLRKIEESTARCFPILKQAAPAMLVRIGVAPPPSARSYRYPPQRLVLRDETS